VTRVSEPRRLRIVTNRSQPARVLVGVPGRLRPRRYPFREEQIRRAPAAEPAEAGEDVAVRMFRGDRWRRQIDRLRVLGCDLRAGERDRRLFGELVCLVKDDEIELRQTAAEVAGAQTDPDMSAVLQLDLAALAGLRVAVRQSRLRCESRLQPRMSRDDLDQPVEHVLGRRPALRRVDDRLAEDEQPEQDPENRDLRLPVLPRDRQDTVRMCPERGPVPVGRQPRADLP